MTGSRMFDLWRGVGLFALAAWLSSAPGPAVAQTSSEEGWKVCAGEGQTCRVDRRTVVRYGAETRWSSRVVSGNVECSNEQFGDPAPQLPKQCEVRDYGVGGGGSGGTGGSTGPGGAAAGWTFCAAEGEICNFRGQSEVRFGTDRQFSVRGGFERVRCGVEDFGDPAFGITKHCEVRSNAALPAGPVRPGWGGPQPTVAWRYCASEGQSCRVNGKTQVRFGDGRRYATRNVEGEVTCGAGTFGDPAFGVVKHCEVLAAAWLGGTAAGWSRCATEGERCTFNGQAQVRYGSGGRYAYREAYNGLNCATPAFGSDPSPGKMKSCEIRR